MKLVWHDTDLIERDWFCYLLGDAVDEEVTDLELSCFDDDAIHVVNTNLLPLQHYEPYFRQLRARCKHLVLFHVADEWLSGGYASYQYFDLVIRWNRSYLTSAPGIVTLPVGYPSKTGASIRPADRRRYAWSFVGEIKSSRIAMVNALEGFKPNFLTRTDDLAKANPKRISKAEFDAVLEDTVFAPCPMGNVTIETTRVYESLELGCIPLVEVRLTLDYFTNLLGHNPLPMFRRWSAARRYAERLYGDKGLLLAKQAEIGEWWQSYKAKLSNELRTALNGPSRSTDLQRFAAKPRNRYAVVHEPLRAIEILRHQTTSSLMRRLVRPVGPFKRILADLSGGRLATPTAVREWRMRKEHAVAGETSAETPRRSGFK
jgi:hypothetical protein